MGPFSERSKRSSFTGSDVVGGSENDSVTADKKAKKGAKNYCAAGGPNKVNCSNKTGTPGISMHNFPKEESLQQKWTWFVRINQKDSVPKKSSCLCSAHFDDSCFEHKPASLTDATGEATELKKTADKRFSTKKNCRCALYASFDWPKVATSKWGLFILCSFHRTWHCFSFSSCNAFNQIHEYVYFFSKINSDIFSHGLRWGCCTFCQSNTSLKTKE